MLSRTLTVPTLLAASVAVPYVATNAPEWRTQWNAAAGPAATPSPFPTANNPTSSQNFAALSASPVGPGAALYPTPMPLEGTPSYSLADVLRMDVTKEWIYQRWPRKSTALAELDLYGVRVPLVTGTQLYDLAGSLTYFFGADGRVQLISFRGRTGDTTQLVGLITQRYGLQPQATIAGGEQLFEARRGSDVVSRLRTRPAPVLWASSPHDSFSVELELQDLTTGRPLRAEAVALPKPPTPPAAEDPSGSASSATGAAADAKKKPAQPAWKAFFPRRNVPEGQIPNLDHSNMYQ